MRWKWVLKRKLFWLFLSLSLLFGHQLILQPVNHYDSFFYFEEISNFSGATDYPGKLNLLVLLGVLFKSLGLPLFVLQGAFFAGFVFLILLFCDKLKIPYVVGMCFLLLNENIFWFNFLLSKEVLLLFFNLAVFFFLFRENFKLAFGAGFLALFLRQSGLLLLGVVFVFYFLKHFKQFKVNRGILLLAVAFAGLFFLLLLDEFRHLSDVFFLNAGAAQFLDFNFKTLQLLIFKYTVYLVWFCLEVWDFALKRKLDFFKGALLAFLALFGFLIVVYSPDLIFIERYSLEYLGVAIVGAGRFFIKEAKIGLGFFVILFTQYLLTFFAWAYRGV